MYKWSVEVDRVNVLVVTDHPEKWVNIFAYRLY